MAFTINLSIFACLSVTPSPDEPGKSFIRGFVAPRRYPLAYGSLLFRHRPSARHLIIGLFVVMLGCDSRQYSSWLVLVHVIPYRRRRCRSRRLQEGSQVRRPSQQLHLPTIGIWDAGPTQFLYYGLYDRTWSSAFSIPLENRARLPFFSVCLSLFKGLALFWFKKPLIYPTANRTSGLFQLFI